MENEKYERKCEMCPFAWDKVMSGKIQIEEALQLFFLNHIDLDCLKCNEPMCKLSAKKMGDYWVNVILNTKVDKLISLIEDSQIQREIITTSNISQFSNFNEVDNVIRILADSGIGNIDYKTIGYFLEGKRKKDAANNKYGENHYKLSVQLGLASVSNKYEISVVGEAYRRLSDDRSKKELKSKLILRIPLIQEAIIKSKNDIVNLTEEMSKYLSQSTVIRRSSNIKKLLSLLTELNSADLNTRIGCIVWGE